MILSMIFMGHDNVSIHNDSDHDFMFISMNFSINGIGSLLLILYFYIFHSGGIVSELKT